MTDPFVDAPVVEDSAQTYAEYRAELEAEQSGKDYDSIKRDLSYQSHIVAELDNLPPQQHIWVDRGLVLSCEGANHPNHRSFKRQIGRAHV